MNHGPDWNLYRSFLAVIDGGSLSGAARDLGLAQPTVARHIEALEAALGGGPLFTRSGAGLRPTRAAHTIAPIARAMASSAEALVRTAAGDAEQERGVVRVTASQMVGAEVLPPMLRDFHEAHPGIAIELVLTNAVEDLLRRDSDIAVRMAQPTQEALLARKVGVARLGFFAHRRYVERHGVPETFDELRRHAIIGFDRAMPLKGAVDRIGIPISAEMFALRTDSDIAQFSAVRAGFGIGVVQIKVAGRDPDLIPVLHERFGFDLPTWVVMHEDLKGDRRMRLMFDHLVAGLTAWLA
jgi:DNA-binding transcriptional LysR family regulator